MGTLSNKQRKSAISVQFIGRVFITPEETENFVEDLFRGIERATNKSVEVESKNLDRAIKINILSQKLRLSKLNKKYKKSKVKRGFDSRIGVKTGAMVNAIKFFKKSESEFFVGVRQQKGSSKTASLPKYTRIFDFGTSNKKQHSRPVFRRTLRSRRSNYISKVLKNLESVFKDIEKIWSK